MPPGRPRVPGQVGTVDTLAGPGFCRGSTRPEPASSTVGAVAASVGEAAGGALWYETGPPGEGLLTKVLSSASAVVEHTGLPAEGEERQRGPSRAVRAASRLAADGRGGVLVAGPTAVVQFGQGATVVAGMRSVPAGQYRGASGDGVPLAQARFRRLLAIATDSAGNAYVADEVDRRRSTIAIRFLNRSTAPIAFYAGTLHEVTVAPGTIGTIAGAAGIPGISRLVAAAPVLAVADGRLYVGAVRPGPRPRATVRVVNLGGAKLDAHGTMVAPGAAATVATVLGRAGGASVGPDPVSPLPGIAADAAGNLFLAEQGNHRVRLLGPGGAMTTFAGTGAPGFNGNDRPAASARLDRPYDVEVGPAGRIYLSDAGNGQVRYVDRAGLIHAALGNGAGNRSRCGGGAEPTGTAPLDQPHPGQPVSLAASSGGDVYLTSPGLAGVQRLGASGALRPVVGGPAAAACGGPSGCEPSDPSEAEPAATARLTTPLALALGPAGTLYIQDAGRVRLVNLGRRQLRSHGMTIPPGTVRTVAGGAPAAGAAAGASDGVNAVAGPIGTSLPVGAVATDSRGNLFIADGLNRSVRQVDAGGRITTLLAGPALEVAARQRPGCCSCCAVPTGLAVDRGGNLYVGDLLTRQVWYLNRGRAPVTVHGVAVAPGAAEPVAGAGRREGTPDEDVPALDAQLEPLGLAAGASGDLYVVHGHTVRRVDTRGTITTVVGTGQQGFNGDGLKGPLTALNHPAQVAIDACGNLLVADSRNDRVRRLNLQSSCSAAPPPAPSAEDGRLPAIGLGAITTVALTLAGAAERRRRQRRSDVADR